MSQEIKDHKTGYYSSTESFGAVDGPGIRLVIFLQGCFFKCKYCHNPETIEFKHEKTISVDEILAMYKKNENFYKKGGITLSGGEATAQIDFCIEVFKAAQAKGINTCLDTCLGTYQEIPAVQEKWKELLKYTDLILADLKHIDNEKHINLTSRPNTNVLQGIKFLDDNNAKMWVRHVLVPGYTDDEQDLLKMGKFVGTLKNMERFEMLPYHNMMIPKYENLKMRFYLKDVEPPTKDYVVKCREIVERGMQIKKSNLNI
ncbi:pyruvate formate-lyase-activating protein [Spiroplasma tabanidicola]|uniref:Pyruvate formate-lyase-activating enzyme n=1 Tax=Spiroplasma tabanidicola TaxID=324079 RepID=A0A6I6CJR8_9MOLU|nr:pyruvate formate-lyase-activating protein [Spiroplasma tabanidicola]QGS52333.1 pyruvate formate lyase activating enzyme [Spiroplasma tabanidicola]